MQTRMVDTAARHWRIAVPLVALMVLQGAGAAWSAGDDQGSLANADREFVENVVHNSRAQVELGELALRNSGSVDVKTFAQQMIVDHRRLAAELTALAKGKGFTAPDGPSMLQMSKVKLLQVAKGNNFDKRYMQTMGIDANQTTLIKFEKAGESLSDNDLKQAARKNLEMVRGHLRMAERIYYVKDAPGEGKLTP